MSEAVIAQKAKIADAVSKQFTDAASVIVVNSRGLTVAQDTDLRKQLRDAGVELHVIKNTILRRAADKAGFKELNDTFVGPTAVAFSNEDVVAPARVIAKFAETADQLVIKGGLIEGKIASLDEINDLSKLPDRDGMLSMLLSVLQAPVRNVAYAVKAVADAKPDEAEEA